MRVGSGGAVVRLMGGESYPPCCSLATLPLFDDAGYGRKVKTWGTTVDIAPRVCVLARGPSGLHAALRVALAQSAHVRSWGAVPPFREVRGGDVLVVDLRDPPRCADLRSLEACLVRGAGLCLVLGDSLVAPAW